MAEKWSPGPWRIESGAIPLGETGDHDSFVAVCGADGDDLVCRWSDGNDERDEANFRLIAAAPDFANIAARAQHLANERGGDYSALSADELCSFMVEYDAALAKARGE